jgi:hypothetical protein
MGDAGSIVRHRQVDWRVVKRTQTKIHRAEQPFEIVLLKSLLPTVESGAGVPMYDVELLIIQGPEIRYDYVENGSEPGRFYMDDLLEVRDVTGDGAPEIRFHSSVQGASGFVEPEHIISYDYISYKKGLFTDISPEIFHNSTQHGLRWLVLRDKTLAIVAVKQWSDTVPEELRCHSCASWYAYTAFQWNPQLKQFVERGTFNGTKAHFDRLSALDSDWNLIQTHLW